MVHCNIPTVNNGAVSCTAAEPTHTDECEATCDVGYWPNYASTMCSVSGNTATFSNDLECEGTVIYYMYSYQKDVLFSQIMCTVSRNFSTLTPKVSFVLRTVLH